MGSAAVPSIERDGPLWEEEVARVRAARASLPAAAIAALRSVLESIASEVDVDPRVAFSAWALLAELAQEPRPAPHPRLSTLRVKPA